MPLPPFTGIVEDDSFATRPPRLSDLASLDKDSPVLQSAIQQDREREEIDAAKEKEATEIRQGFLSGNQAGRDNAIKMLERRYASRMSAGADTPHGRDEHGQIVSNTGY